MHDPRSTIADTPMRGLQIGIVALCIALNALDGFDVLSISFASPGISTEWGIDRAALGVVLSMELIGMTAGSLALGALCDRWGRRPTVLLCLAIMASGMAAAALANDVRTLSLARLYTGCGIGGMLAATNAVVAEFSNVRRKYMAVALMAGGYPLGAVVGGTIASKLLVTHSWHSVFALGACISAALLPICFFLLPETIAFLDERRPHGALVRINRVLARLGHDVVDGLPERTSSVGGGLAGLFAPALARTTALMTATFFAHMMTFYFILKWAPKIVADMGFPPSAAGGVLVWANVGGLTGSIVFSLVSQRIDVRPLAIGATLLSTVAVSAFGHAPPTLGALGLFAAIAGFFTNGVVVCLYALLATRLPTGVRAAGTGFAIGIGRGGAALSPIIVGQLFAHGSSTGTTAAIIGLGSLVACLALVLLPQANRPAA